jgi:solute carrier family 25 thiamine pyrophosphate transporter 19
LIQFVQQMYQKQGLRGFYAGVTPALIQIIPYMGCNFAIYDYLTTRPTTMNDNSHNHHHNSNNNNSNQHPKPPSSKISIGLSAYAGSISGAISKMIVYPLDTVKRRLQSQAFFTTTSSSHLWSVESHVRHPHDTATSSSPPSVPNHHSNDSQYPHRNRHQQYRGMYDCIRSIYQNEGILAFYRGIVPSVLKTAIATSLTFSCFRWTQNTLHWTHDRLLQHHQHTT